MICQDHLGNEFKSKRAMCEHYGIDYKHEYCKRLASGWSLKDTLTTPVLRYTKTVEDFQQLYRGKNGCYEDHLGNYYTELNIMCKCWHIPERTFLDRVKHGFTVERALTFRNKITEPDIDDTVIWVFDEPFPSYNAVDIAYGFSINTCRQHRDDIEGWLSSKSLYFVDGQLYRTLTSLALAYEIAEATLSSRIRKGMSAHAAVHLPVVNNGNGIPCTDHLGNEYPSRAAMLLAYNIGWSAYKSRINRGWTLERTLTTPVSEKLKRATRIPEAV